MALDPRLFVDVQMLPEKAVTPFVNHMNSTTNWFPSLDKVLPAKLWSQSLRHHVSVHDLLYLPISKVTALDSLLLHMSRRNPFVVSDGFATSVRLVCKGLWPALVMLECNRCTGGLGVHLNSGHANGVTRGGDSAVAGFPRGPPGGGAPDSHQRPDPNETSPLHVCLLRLQHSSR